MNGSYYAAHIANTWTTPVSIAVERDNEALPIDSFARIPSGSGPGITSHRWRTSSSSSEPAIFGADSLAGVVSKSASR